MLVYQAVPHGMHWFIIIVLIVIVVINIRHQIVGGGLL